MAPEYAGPEHRKKRHGGDDPVTNNDLDEALTEHSEEERKYVASLIQEVLRAFPDGVETHRAYHESLIEARKAEKEFWDTAKKSVISNGIAGLFGLLKVIMLLAALGLTVKFSMPDAAAKIILGALSK